jgi:hypothetical protein
MDRKGEERGAKKGEGEEGEGSGEMEKEER